MKGNSVKVKVTKRVLNKLLAHKKRTGIGAYAITKGRKEAKPTGLNGKSLSDILNGKSNFIKQEHLDYILARYEDTPDKPKSMPRYQNGSASIRAKAGYEVLSEHDLKKLRHYRELGFLPSQFLKTSLPPPKGFNNSIVSGWLSGKVIMAHPTYLNFVLDECTKLKTNPQKPIVIDEELLNELHFHKERTGHGGILLLKFRNDIPSGLTQGIISSWLNGRVKIARTDYISYVLKLWQHTPDRGASKFTPPQKRSKNVQVLEYGIKRYPRITSYALNKIKQHIENGLTTSAVFKLTTDMPLPITQRLVLSWINGQQKTANPELVRFYLKACKYAAKHPQRPIEIDEQSYQQLIKNRDRTGVSAQVLLKNTKIKPVGLIANTIYGWLSKETQVARKDYLNFVIALWKSLPDKETISDVTKEHSATQRPLLEKKWIRDKREFDKKYPVEEKIRTVEKKTPAPKALIVITYDMHQQLMVHNQQAHISGAQLLKNAKNAPQGLRPEMIDNWIIERFKTARKDHWDYVMALYEARMQK